MFFKRIVLLALPIALGACASTGPGSKVNNVQTGPCPEAPGMWCDFVRKAAVKTWRYAQIADNSYDRPYRYELNSHFKSRGAVDNDGIGFAYEIVDRFENGELAEVIIAFRGTEGFFNFRDWWHGNITGRQNKRGVALVENEFAELAARGQTHVPISVTGHSLGGGIAHHVSTKVFTLPDGSSRTVEKSYVFNNSPRFSGGAAKVERIAIVERGEVLKLLRAPASEATQTYISINCKAGARPIRDHTMTHLADCLTWIAAFEDERARESLALNDKIQMPATQGNQDSPI